MVSLMLHLPLPFPIVNALETDLGSLKIAFESAHEFWGTHVPLEVVGQSGSTSVEGSVCSGLFHQWHFLCVNSHSNLKDMGIVY